MRTDDNRRINCPCMCQEVLGQVSYCIANTRLYYENENDFSTAVIFFHIESFLNFWSVYTLLVLYCTWLAKTRMSSLNESSEQTSLAASPALPPPPPPLLPPLLATVVPDAVVERAVTVANSHFSNTSASRGNTGCLWTHSKHVQVLGLKLEYFLILNSFHCSADWLHGLFERALIGYFFCLFR